MLFYTITVQKQNENDQMKDGKFIFKTCRRIFVNILHFKYRNLETRINTSHGEHESSVVS